MNTTEQKLGYSADVQMRLHVNGFVIPIGQLGPDFLIVRNAPDHPASEAEIEMWIDDDERRWKVYLPDGISSEKTRTRIVSN